MRYFAPHEIACRCCGHIAHDLAAQGALDNLRALVGGPLYVTSGTRCPAHNVAVGGAPRSLHLVGKAFDLRWPRIPPLQFLGFAHTAGFSGVGFYRDFIHLDTGAVRRW